MYFIYYTTPKINKISSFIMIKTHQSHLKTIQYLHLARVLLMKYLFGVLHHFQNCTGHITTGSFVGRGNQYIQLVKVLYCKLLTIGKQLPTFAHKVFEPPNSEVAGKCVNTVPPVMKDTCQLKFYTM